MSMCVCVCEIERGRETETHRERHTHTHTHTHTEREREIEREREREREREKREERRGEGRERERDTERAETGTNWEVEGWEEGGKWRDGRIERVGKRAGEKRTGEGGSLRHDAILKLACFKAREGACDQGAHTFCHLPMFGSNHSIVLLEYERGVPGRPSYPPPTQKILFSLVFRVHRNRALDILRRFCHLSRTGV
jgi:hypothetical protein